MLSKVTNNIVDTNSGAGSGAGTGLTAKIGVSSVASPEPIVIRNSMDSDTIKEKLGNSPLADACIDAVENGAGTIYCLPVAATTQGTISEAEHVGTGTATVEASGHPTNEFVIIVRVETGGLTNEATVSISENDGVDWLDEQTVPLGGAITVPNTGVTLTFTADASKVLVAGDTYTFKATAPAASTANIVNAVNVFRTYPAKIEMIHIVGTTAPALWASLEALGKTWEKDYGRPLLFLVEHRKPASGETAAAYAAAIKADAKSVKGRHVAVVSQWASYVRLDGRQQDINMAGCISGWIASSKESTSIAFVRDFVFAEGKVVKLLPEGIGDYMNELDECRYIFLRTYNGMDGFYVASANTTAPATSTFCDIETARVMYRLSREVYQRALEHQNEDFDQSEPEVAYQYLQADLNVPVDDAVRDEIISEGAVTILTDEINPGKDKKVPVRIQCVPRGYFREINLNFYVVNSLA